MRFFKHFLLIMFIVSLLVGCTVQPKIQNNVYFEGKEDVVDYICMRRVSNNDLVWKTCDKTEILTVLATFNGWKPEENKAELLGLMLEYSIHFDDALTVYYSPSSRENNYYGQINNDYYYLPSAFGEYLKNLWSIF